MGIFKKVFKKVGKVFKGIGKTIKKGFQKFGTFMNKLGIFGQIGMMFIMPALGNMAMQGLMQLGSGFMTGLASAGWTTTAGVSVATPGIMSGAARVSHAVLSTAAKVAETGMNVYRTITDTITGVVTDTAVAIGNKMGLTEKMVPIINPLTNLPEATASEAGSILKNAASRFQAGATKTWGSLTDAARVVGDVMPGGAKYSPQYETFEVPTGEVTEKGRPKFKEVTREVGYSTANRKAYDEAITRLGNSFDVPQSLLGKATSDPISDFTHPKAVTSTVPVDSPMTSFGWKDRVQDVFSPEAFEKAGATVLAQEGAELAMGKGRVEDASRLFPSSSFAETKLFTDFRGSGQPLFGTGFHANERLHPESIDFLTNVLNLSNESYLDMPYVKDMFIQSEQKKSINGGQGQFGGRLLNLYA